MSESIPSSNDAATAFAASAEMRSILEHSERNILVLDSQYRILWFNSLAARTMSRYFNEPLKSGYTYWDYVDRDANKRFVRNFEQALKGKRVSVERRIEVKEDKDVWIEGTFSPLHSEDGQIAGVIYSYQNITQRKRKEQEEVQRDNIIGAIESNDSQAFILLDSSDRVVSCNHVAGELIGRNSSGGVGQGTDIWNCVPHVWAEQFSSGLKVARSGGTAVVEFETTGLGFRVIEVRFCPVNSQEDEDTVTLWAFDITDKKRAERELIVSEENLRSVFNSSSQTFYLLDHELNILAFNEAAKVLVREQYGTELQVGQNVADITPTERMPQLLAETSRAFKGHKVQVEKHFSTNGREYWFERHINPIRNGDGVVDRIAIWSIDITERKRAEEALRENEAKFRQLATIMPVGIYQADANGNTVYVNESIRRIMRVPVSTILSGEWNALIHPDDREMVMQNWAKSTGEHSPYQLEYRLLDGQGHVTYLLEQAIPLFNNQREYTGHLGTVIDLTVQRANQQLQQEKDVAEQSLRFRSDFLASMSHEIRTPLTAILALTELLLE